MDTQRVVVSQFPQPDRSPVLTWVPVTRPDGRIKMEMRWLTGSPSTARTAHRYGEAA
ncbi:hypothetical protein K0651_01540 [Ornithinimicrobium sp. Arc0846-15]|nr:hypothetical protein [Ornithinimicrobium laminariae]